MGKNYKKEIEHGFEKTFQKTNDFLKHKNTVIGLTILSVLCILWYSMSNQMVALVIFAVSGLITRLYIKSTGHVLMVAMVTTIIITSLMNKNIMEGLEGDDEEIDDGEEDTATASNGNITELPTKPKKVKKTKKSSEDDADEDTTETFEGVNAPSSVTNNNVGKPKQQRSQEVDPPAPMDKSASNISSAILFALIITLIFLSLA